jgi:hypothetical protein
MQSLVAAQSDLSYLVVLRHLELLLDCFQKALFNALEKDAQVFCARSYLALLKLRCLLKTITPSHRLLDNLLGEIEC